MNKYQLADAYAAVTKNFSLRAAQRDNLDRSDDYLRIMQLAHEDKWASVEVLMEKNNYFKPADPDDPVFELVN